MIPFSKCISLTPFNKPREMVKMQPIPSHGGGEIQRAGATIQTNTTNQAREAIMDQLVMKEEKGKPTPLLHPYLL